MSPGTRHPLDQAITQVRKHADKALETLLAHDPSKETMIRELKFKTFNQEWLDFMDQNVDSINVPAQSPMSPPPHEALMGLYDDDDTAQVLPTQPMHVPGFTYTCTKLHGTTSGRAAPTSSWCVDTGTSGWEWWKASSRSQGKCGSDESTDPRPGGGLCRHVWR